MEKEVITKESINHIFDATPHILNFPSHRLVIDYDKGADVLYISFERPQRATDSEMLENGIIVRYRGDKVVGLTILDASKRGREER